MSFIYPRNPLDENQKDFNMNNNNTTFQELAMSLILSCDPSDNFK